MARGLREINLTRRAVKARWPIPKTKRGAIMREMVEIATTTEDVRSRVAAARVLLAADALNMDQEKRDDGSDNTLNVNVRGGIVMTVEQAVEADRELARWEREHRRALPAGQSGAGNTEGPPVLPVLRDPLLPDPGERGG